MASTKEHSGLGTGNSIVKLASGVDLGKIELTAQEGFILSRVDGATTIDLLCVISGLGEGVTIGVLQRLRSLGLIQIAAAAPARGRQTPTSSVNARLASPAPEVQAPTPHRSTTRETPSSALPSSVRTVTPSSVRTVTPSSVRTVTPSSTTVGEPPAKSPTGPAFKVTPEVERAVAEDPPDIELKPELRKNIRSFYTQLQGMTFFELVGVDPDADAAVLRRAYFKRSKEYHPDRFFNKNLGPYKEMLQEIFKQISGAVRLLEDEEKRKAYQQMLLQEKEQSTLARAVEDQGERAMQETERAEMQEEARPPEARPSEAPPPEARPPEAPPPEAAPSEAAPPEARSSEYSFIPRSKRGSREQVAVDPAEKRSATGSFNFISESEAKAREQRRTQDRQRRISILTAPLAIRGKKAREFYEQGVKQLAAGQVMAAAASLKLAVSFNPNEIEYKRLYDEAQEKSRVLAAENCFKRALFEESVGRLEAASKNFIKAAELKPSSLHLQRAAEYLLAGGDLIKAKDYATAAMQADPGSVDARITLAKVYVAGDLKKNARRELQAALKIDSGNSIAKELLRSIKGD